MLVDDVTLVIKKAWSFKLAVLSAVFSASEVALPFFTGLIPPGTMASLAVLSAVGAATMRIVYQPNMHPDTTTEAPK